MVSDNRCDLFPIEHNLYGYLALPHRRCMHLNAAPTRYNWQSFSGRYKANFGYSLSLSSSITIHGLSSSKGLNLIHLTRNQSFPAKRYASDLKATGPEGDSHYWDAISPLVGRLHADLEITEPLSEGRIGMVFAARLVSLRQSVHEETVLAHSLPLPSQFCVKLAKPEYFRSLAREA
ncbi:hypothetical protein J3R30DRAFT_1130981 [Lentinula aciculospora]|uniref:Uncharacterized protein n=1 Tax=Lentinula aciculospora TaxID=153920 RepID=A0A9W9DIB9_9AGAR|nr:hypothetical protein J3R30DRAFT_1130981 [Lentinula aciculospora]